MVEAATNAVRSSPAARRYFPRLAQRKHRNVARVALARDVALRVDRNDYLAPFPWRPNPVPAENPSSPPQAPKSP